MTLTAPYYGHGIELKAEHYEELLGSTPPVDWVEVITERFLHLRGGLRFEVLERIRGERPVALHGTTLSIGSVDPLRMPYLTALKELADRIEPAWISDHLAWSSFGDRELDLLPLPCTEESLRHVVGRVGRVQDFLGRRLLLENPTSYVGFRSSCMPEWEFLSAVAEEADCGILLDVNNVFVTGHNLGFDPLEYLDGLPKGRVCEIHLAGHRDAGEMLIDTHEGPVPAPVWQLYREAVRRFGRVSTILEWDTAVPGLSEMVAECHQATYVEREASRVAGAPASELCRADCG